MSSNFDAGDDEHVAKRKIEVKRLDQSRINGLKKLAGDQDGRAWLWSILEQSSPLSTPFAPQSQAQTNFNCGIKILGTQIVNDLLTHCREDYFRMVDESKETK